MKKERREKREGKRSENREGRLAMERKVRAKRMPVGKDPQAKPFLHTPSKAAHLHPHLQPP